MSTITPEITHLPRFDTTNAELDESVLSLDLRTALGGFVLDETTDFSDAAQSGGARAGWRGGRGQPDSGH